METRKNIQIESDNQTFIKELKARLAQIQEQRKNLAEEKIELFVKIKEQRDKLNKQQEQFVLPIKNKPDEYKKAFDDTIRKGVYFYDYLPIRLSVMQINFSSNKEALVRELNEIAKSAEDFKNRMEQENEKFAKMYKNLDELEKKPDQVEMKLINEENQILQKLYVAQVNSSSFFQPNTSSSGKVEKDLPSEVRDGECKPKNG